MFLHPKPVSQSIEEQYSTNDGLEIRKLVVFGNDIEKSSYRDDPHQECLISFPPHGSYPPLNLSSELASKHLLLLGGIGSGKTNTFYFIIDSIMQMMTNNDITIIFDTKGDYAEKFYDPKNPNHILIGNNREYRDTSWSWNIFGELKNSTGEYDEDESMLMAKEISSHLFRGRTSSYQPFFTNAAADIISKVLMCLIRHRNDTLTTDIKDEALANFILNRKGKELSTGDFVTYIQNSIPKSYHNMLWTEPGFRSAAMYLGVKSDGSMVGAQGQGVLSTINSMLNDLFVGPFAGNHDESRSFSMRELVRKKGKKLVFVEYDVSVGETLGPMYSVLFDLALMEALGGRSKTGNVYFIIDEASLVPNLMHLQDALNFGRSLGVKVFAGLQSVSQFYDTYGEERGKVIVSGFMNSFCFQTLDLESRRFVSDRFGSNYQHISYTFEHPASIQREGKVVEDWDILNLGIGEAFVNLACRKPVFFRYRFPEYVDRTRIYK